MANTSRDITDRFMRAELGLDDRPVFSSGKSRMSASGSRDVNVNVKLDTKDIDIEAALTKVQSRLEREASAPIGTKALLRLTRSIMKEVIECSLERQISEEFDDLVAAYRDMLERRAVSGRDEAISRALTRVKLQTDTLASVPMVDQAEACMLLGLSDTNPSATLKRYEARDRILRYDWKGKAAYPLFQFDVAERRIHPTLVRIMELRTDDWGGKMALLNWLTRPNRSLGNARPCDRLSEDAEVIMAAFSAEIAEPLNR